MCIRDRVAALRARGVMSDSRGQTLRLSPGILTTEAGTERLLAALADILA